MLKKTWIVRKPDKETYDKLIDRLIRYRFTAKAIDSDIIVFTVNNVDAALMVATMVDMALTGYAINCKELTITHRFEKGILWEWQYVLSFHLYLLIYN